MLKCHENDYKQGREMNVAPFDEVISFVFRFKPDKPHREIKILEVGCGAGNNLAFLKRLGFQVYGVENAPTAARHAASLGISVYEQSFVSLPLMAHTFDMVIDRAALCYVSPEHQKKAISEIHRVLVNKGLFLFTPYSMNINGNSAYTYHDAMRFLPSDKWSVLGAEGVMITQKVGAGEWQDKESHFRIYAQKV